MTPAARVETAIDLLARMDALEAPADGLARHFFRSRRYIGAKDRRAISDLVYAVLRNRARLDWRIAALAPEIGGVRGRVLTALALVERRSAAEIRALFDGSRYHPECLAPDEDRLVSLLEAEEQRDQPDYPDWVRYEQQPWVLARLRDAFGEDLDRELSALQEQAPLDLRVNALKGDREAAAAALAAEGIEAEATPLSPWGLRVRGRHTLPALAAFRDGLVEVQDEGSQVVALISDARPGQRVADLCAGAGGKTLALGATMENRGQLIALDRNARRLERAVPRLARAGVTIAELRGFDGSEDPWLAEQGGRFDRVLVDAPCTGSGAWRRNPDARWRLTEASLAGHLESQAESLALAARLVAPGGRLIYATCSLLAEENMAQVDRFRAGHADFALLPVADVWARTVGGAFPAAEPTLLLTPARHRCDGFFVAVLERHAEP